MTDINDEITQASTESSRVDADQNNTDEHDEQDDGQGESRDPRDAHRHMGRTAPPARAGEHRARSWAGPGTGAGRARASGARAR